MSEILEAPAPSAEDLAHQQRITENEAAQAEVPQESVEALKTEAEQAEEAAAKIKNEESLAKAREAKADKRFAALHAQKKELERRLAEAEKLIPKLPERDPTMPMTPEELDREIDRRAEERLKAKDAAERDRAFNAECNKVAIDGEKEFGEEFKQALAALWDTIGGVDTGLIEAALETGNPHQVLFKLGQDHEEAERIAGLSPARKGAALARLAAASNPLAATAAPVSKAPEPIKPLSRGGGQAEPRLDSNKQDEFEKAYRLELKKRGR